MKTILAALTVAVAAISLSSCASKPATAPAPVDMGMHSGK